MADGIRAEVQGADALASSLRAAADDLASMPAANAAAGDIIVRSAQHYAPRRTGALMATIRSQPEADGAVVVAGQPPRVGYAGYIEYGTRYMAAQPFLTPGAEATQGQWLRAYQSGVDDALGKVHGA